MRETGEKNVSRGRRVGVALVTLALLVPMSACSPEVERTPEPVEQDGQLLPATADEPAVTSTPRDQWRKGEMPYLYQIDPQWSEAEYGGGRFAKQGCGPTALDMVYIYLTGDTSYDPAGMAAFATENGYSTNLNGSSWSLMTEGAAQLGLVGTSITPTADALRAELEAGRPVICIMNPGTFTEVGHYLVLTGVDTDGRVRMHNPNAPEDNEVSWDLSVIMNDARNYWAYSA